MGSQKIPLFEGIMKAVGDPAPTFIDLFTPLDRNLTDGTQAFYEVHMWISPEGTPTDVYELQAVQSGNPAAVPIWNTDNLVAAPFQQGLPIKMLDGYPVRGDVTIQGSFLSAASSSHVFGYYYRVGQGEVLQPARRFIGQDLSPTFDAGLPINFAAGEKKVIHKFVSGRIDEISLAFMQSAPEVLPPVATLRFEDSNGVILAGTTPVLINLETVPDFRRNPASPYTYYQIALGGSPAQPNLAQMSIESAVPLQQDFSVHGYFTRH
jgi:hypothetical protein